MIVYFADRQLNILGQASTELPDGLIITDDSKTEEVETGVGVFECKIPFNATDREKVEEYTEVGNYILRSHDGENEFYTITEAEIDTKKQCVYIYAEDDGMDLLNDVAGAYEADKAYPIDHYINKYAAAAGFVIGVNEAKNLTRKLSWDGESTSTARIASIATQFDGCEVSYSFEVDGLLITKKYINIYKKRGQDLGITLRLNEDIDSIVTTKSITNLATALQCTGGTPENEDNPITLQGYKYDDGDFYVEGILLKSREALKRWSRYHWKTDESAMAGGHIVKLYSYDTLEQSTLCSRAITELKKIRDMEINYQVDLKRLPDNVKIGDRVNIVDDAGGLYISARILKLDASVADQEYKATIGEYLIKNDGIHQKVLELADQFSKTTQSVARALKIANTAKDAADEAQAQADSAVAGSQAAQEAAQSAQTTANAARESASLAQEKAAEAQEKVDTVEKSVEAIETTVANAQAAAEQAQQAAATAETKASEAHQAAVNAQAKADEAAAEAGNARTKADNAVTKADTAQSTAEQAIADAEAAATTAAAAKLDAENAQKDIDSLGDSLTTLENTMTADYARKTDLTESEAKLQTQISQNAAQITSTATKVQEIDETANNAAEQAQQAAATAGAAQAQADQATADAQAAQTAADKAATAAQAAQGEADTAKAAAATAQGVADKAKADLDAAKADLATVTSRIDATEEEVAAAQQAVEAAQTAANNAQAEADAAAKKATDAQSTADTAVTNAANAQSAANEAANKADLAQQAADAAKGDAAAAQAKADEAAQTAAEAQQTANTAAANAATAQSAANQAAANAAAAQKAADDAEAKAAKAASDLATAQQNLADVTSRVDATEEEVAAAQQAVNTAQAAADKAKQDAEAAQATADTAKANAATAQTAADNAKAAADQAQADATAAQQAADKAQADVDALAVRVTTAETKIEQNSEQISLMAKKSEVAEMLGGYSTKEETEAAITVKANEITQTVSRTYATKQAVDDIKIGGRNLVICKDLVPCYSYYELLVEENHSIISSQNFTYYFEIGNLRGNLVPGKVYTMSNKSITTTSDYENRVMVRIWNFATSTSYLWLALYSGGCLTFTVPAEIDVANTGLLIYPGGEDAFDFTIEELKLEHGNKATDWTPAPEDVEAEIDTAQSTANGVGESVSAAESAIQQLANSIATLIVDGNGASLMKQTESGWVFSIGEIESTLSAATQNINGLSEDVNQNASAVESLKQSVDDLGVLANYIKITVDGDQPCIELGESENDFKVRITNTEIHFADGTVIPTRITRQMMIIEKAMMRDSLQFGDDEEAGISGVWILKRRSNGNLGLAWKGVS